MRNFLKPFPKTLHVIAALILLTVTAAPSAHAAEVAIGAPAPTFTLTDTNGTSHTLSDFLGKTVVLEWTNHECPYVRKHYDTGNMQQLQQEAAADGVIWLSIVSSAPGKQGYTTPEEAKALLASEGAHPTARLADPDGTVGMAYGAKTTPHMYVIDPQGTLVYMGAIDNDPSTRADAVKNANNYVRAALAAVKTGKMPETTQTAPYGCGVKYRM